MFIVMITPECASAAKVNSLADVVHGLSQAMQPLQSGFDPCLHQP